MRLSLEPPLPDEDQLLILVSTAHNRELTHDKSTPDSLIALHDFQLNMSALPAQSRPPVGAAKSKLVEDGIGDSVLSGRTYRVDPKIVALLGNVV